jgi:uracil-DNA glycosylase
MMADPANAQLESLAAQIRECRHCLEYPEKYPLPHQPRPVLHVSSTARLCIAGQAPGTRVHKSGIPFDDPSGDRLRAWMGIDREVFYDQSRLAIVPMGFCFPGLDTKGGDLPPRRECAPKWRQQVFALLPQIELILVIGQYAQKWHLGSDRKKSLTQTVRDWQNCVNRDVHPRCLPLPHPSWRNTGWLKKNPWFEAEILPYLMKEVGRLT